MRRPRVPVLAPVLLLAGVGIGVLAAQVADGPEQPATPAAAPAAPAAASFREVGTEELVRITGPTGETVEAVARIDTGASASSIDDDIAEDLGFDLENADTVTVASSLGREERPVVIGALQLDGEATAARFSVTDRSQRSTPVLLGRDDLRGVHVVVGDAPAGPDGDDADRVRPYEEDPAARERLVALIEEAQRAADDTAADGTDEDQDDDDDQ